MSNNNDLDKLREGFRLLFHSYMTGDSYGNSGEKAFAIDDALRAYKNIWPDKSVSNQGGLAVCKQLTEAYTNKP